MSALPQKADIIGRRRHVRFVPKADSAPVASLNRPSSNITGVATLGVQVCAQAAAVVAGDVLQIPIPALPRQKRVGSVLALDQTHARRTIALILFVFLPSMGKTTLPSGSRFDRHPRCPLVSLSSDRVTRAAYGCTGCTIMRHSDSPLGEIRDEDRRSGYSHFASDRRCPRGRE